jgi:hypothetical protein
VRDKDMHDNEDNIDALNLKELMRHFFLKDFVHVQHNDEPEKDYHFSPENGPIQIIF